ncbi:MAG TPA: DHA2 family efflux MFS transporter permease subunit [Thermoleophilaceae bacterium]|nr:DHA2 family efflux MFS transporter permease subunit [Thermoleophilaceae bacterium]
MTDENRFFGLERSLLAIAAVVVVGAIMSILDTTIVNIALRTLGDDLDASLGSVQWVSTGYLLSLALVIPLTGWAAERYGARRVWLVSVVLFVAGSALCGAAWSLGSLIGFRVLQGFGGGMIMPAGMILIAQAAGPRRMGRVMSVIGVPMVLAPALGPVLGGLIVDNVSWRWIFFVNVPIGILGIWMGLRQLPRGQGSRDAGRVDLVGLALLSPGLALAVFGLSEVASHGGVRSTRDWLPLVLGAALSVAFCWHALRAERPLIDLRLFKGRAFAAGSATTFLVGAALFGGLLVMPLYYQLARGASPLEAGLLLAPQGFGVMLAMPFTGRLTDRVGGGRVALVGLLVLTVSTIPFAVVDSDTPYAWLASVLFVRGVGIGATMMPAMAAAYATMETAEVPKGTTVLNVVQRVGGSIGTAILAVVLQHEISAKVPGARGGLLGGGAATHGAAPPGRADALANAFGTTFWWTVVMGLLALGPTLLLARATRQAPAGAEVPVESLAG